ncbi:MAG: DUF397 domain-containing protein [Actinomycetota bacterium]|nr:DUF397 domain-containing protein [Actinomycetota bacterium]
MTTTKITRWRRSSSSGSGNNCVELDRGIPHTAVRDSKAPQAGSLSLRDSSFRLLLATIES